MVGSLTSGYKGTVLGELIIRYCREAKIVFAFRLLC